MGLNPDRDINLPRETGVCCSKKAQDVMPKSSDPFRIFVL